MKLSIVMPVFDEKTTLEEIVRRVLAVEVGLDKELVIVDDGSTDGTRDLYDKILADHPDGTVQLHLHEKNQGKGAALRTGFSHATGDIVLVQDADLEYDPKDYHRLLKPILDGRADVVYGSRFVGSEEHRVLFFWHMVGNRLLTLMSNALTNLNLTDMETCYKVFRAEVLKNITIKSNRFDFEPEITAKVAKGKWRIYEVGVSYSGRDYAEGKKIGFRDAVKAVWTIFRYRVAD